MALTLGAASCVDPDYDLDDIDLTLGIDTDLTFPASSTSDILLKNILDLEQQEIVQNIDGEYYLVEEGSADLQPVHIDPIAIKSPDVSFKETYVDLNLLTKGASQRRKTDGISLLEQQTLLYTIQEHDSAFYDADFSSSDPITEDVVSIDEITLEPGTAITLGMTIQMEERYSFIHKIHYDDFTLTLPRGLYISEASCTYIDETGSHLRTIAPTDIDNEKGIVRLTPPQDPTGNLVNHPIQITLTLGKIYVGEDITFADHKATLTGRFQLNGTYRLERSEMDIPATLLQEAFAQGDASLICPDYVNILGTAKFECEEIRVKSFTGQLKHHVEDIAPISLDELPNFLEDEDVVLDLENPVIFVRLLNPFPCDVHTSMSLTSHYATTPEVSRHTGHINIPASQETIFYICESSQDVKVPAEYSGKHLQWIRVDDLKGLLRKVPQSIEVNVADITMDCHDMPISGDYQVELEYKIFSPIAFGPDFRLVYVDTERNLSMDLEDIDNIDFTRLSLSANVLSDMPLDLSLTLTPLDEDGNVLQGLVVEQLGTIKANSQGTPVTFALQAEAGHTINEFISGKNAQGQRVPRFDGIKYRAVALGNQGGALTEQAKLRLTDIKLRVVGKVTIDANESEEEGEYDNY